jgi:methionyl-tRNA formyltransferase
MRIIFMGTPEFAVPAFHAVHHSGHEIVAVYTAPPRPAHRGKKLTKSPVHTVAEVAGLKVHTPTSLKNDDAQETLRQHDADIAVVVAYGLLLPQAILDAPRLGCINIHPSDLPRWRGAAPIQRSIMAGDTLSAACIMQMNAGLDTGDVLAREPFTIDDTMTAHDVQKNIATLSAALLLRTLDGLAEGKITATPQSELGATYAAKIDKTEAVIDFHRPAQQVLRHIHGLSPFPGAYFMHQGERIKLHHVECITGINAPAGTVISADCAIQCADGNAIRPIIMQRSGKQPMPATECLRGLSVTLGESISA